MAVYTPITQDQLDSYLEAFTLPPLTAFNGIAAGVSNSNFTLHFADGSKRILTLFEERTPREDLPYFLALMEHLAALSIPCPRPVRGSDGGALHQLAGRPAAMVSFLDGQSVTLPDGAHCAAVGRMMAHMHRAVADFPLKRRNSMHPGVWQELLDRSDDGTAAMALVLRHAQHVAAHWPRHLPQGAIHADLFPDNIFFSGRDLCGVIDYYFACHDNFAYDLAIGLNAWCAQHDGSLAPNCARALLHAYQADRALTPAEIDALPLLLQGAALRFLSSRQYDWVHRPPGALVTPKDPAAYRRILQWHLDNPLAVQDWLL